MKLNETAAAKYQFRRQLTEIQEAYLLNKETVDMLESKEWCVSNFYRNAQNSHSIHRWSMLFTWLKSVPTTKIWYRTDIAIKTATETTKS